MVCLVCLIDWFIDWLIFLFVGGLVDWLIRLWSDWIWFDWLVDCLIERSFWYGLMGLDWRGSGWFIDWFGMIWFALVCWLFDWLVGSSLDWLICCSIWTGLKGWLIDWICLWFNLICLFDWLVDWLNGLSWFDC